MSDLLMRREALMEAGRRWVLRRIWGDGPRISWGACNPSIADAEREDPSLWRMIKFSQRWGFGSMSLWNAWPWITPDQAQCRMWLNRAHGANGEIFDPYRRDDLMKNLNVISAECAKADTVILAMGNAWAWDEAWIEQIIEVIGDVHPKTLFCLGLTKDGYPTHPLARGKHRIPDDALMRPFRDGPPAVQTGQTETATAYGSTVRSHATMNRKHRGALARSNGSTIRQIPNWRIASDVR